MESMGPRVPASQVGGIEADELWRRSESMSRSSYGLDCGGQERGIGMEAATRAAACRLRWQRDRDSGEQR